MIMGCSAVRRRVAIVAALLSLGVALVPAGVSAHAGAPAAPHDLRGWQVWLPEPLVVAAIAGAAWLYGRGLRRMLARGRSRGRVWLLRCGTFGGGLLALAFALASPLEVLSGALLWAHMLQHLLLILVAAPLLVLGAAHVPMLRVLPPGWRRTTARLSRRRAVRRGGAALAALPVAWLLQAGALVVWHVPALYETALTSEALHILEHACFLGTALLFWWAVLGEGARARLRYGLSVVALFLAALLGGGMGALMTFARSPWYPAYAAGEAAWAISPLMDQRAAGLIMWMPGGLLYAVAAAVLLALWLAAVEREMERRERPPVPARGGVPAMAQPAASRSRLPQMEER
jgi:putative membrane protein